ncbi:hypothetical protein BJX63DRAFT_410713 [Aspergillus granulosus]|uniref:Uncharacterized protein n=1 Tax=Aspergillus granulosus TaxID=176169 RepID=A0ABR4GXV3_9EURO
MLPKHLDEGQEMKVIANGSRDKLKQRGPYSPIQLPYEGTSNSQAADRSLQGNTVYELHSALSLGGTQNNSLDAGAEQGQLNRDFRKRAGVFGKESDYERKRARKTSSLINNSSIGTQSTQSTFQHCHMSSQTRHRENSGTVLPFHDVSGNAVSLSVTTQTPCVTDTSDDISICDGPENDCLSSNRAVQPSTQRVSISIAPGSRTIIDKNGSPRRPQEKGEQMSSYLGAPVSTKATERLSKCKNTGALKSARHVTTPMGEKHSSFLNSEGLPKVLPSGLNESPKITQEHRLNNGNKGQGTELQGSLASRLSLEKVALNSKRVFELTADATHRQKLLQELHREIERILLSTNEVRQSRNFKIITEARLTSCPASTPPYRGRENCTQRNTG